VCAPFKANLGSPDSFTLQLSLNCIWRIVSLHYLRILGSTAGTATKYARGRMSEEDYVSAGSLNNDP
jgi:hypothetical protein